MEEEGSSSGQVKVGRSSSREVGVELTARNLARVDNQPLVRGPLKQSEEASRRVMNEIHETNIELDELNHSITLLKGQVDFLQNQIATLQAAEQDAAAMRMRLDDARMKELENLLDQQDGMSAMVQQQEERRNFLMTKLDEKERMIDRTLRRLRLPLGGNRSNANPPRYPAHVDLTEQGEVVPEEEDRPW